MNFVYGNFYDDLLHAYDKRDAPVNAGKDWTEYTNYNMIIILH